MHAVTERQLADLGERFATVDATPLPDGSVLVRIHDVALPPGWSAGTTNVLFVVPASYPFAALDCFWTDGSLTLASGVAPQNTAINPIPGVPHEPLLWFSWHLTGAWDPNRDTLSGWMNSVLERMRRAT